MSTAISGTGRRIHVRRPSLRLLHGERELSAAETPAEERSRILLVGVDPGRRASLRKELTSTLPPSTQFEEAGEVWEVLEHAPSSSVVMLTGDLQGVSAESLMHLLGDRYPKLPVVALDTRVNTLAVA
jgi:DNA-binding NtrC family response regulator